MSTARRRVKLFALPALVGVAIAIGLFVVRPQPFTEAPAPDPMPAKTRSPIADESPTLETETANSSHQGPQVNGVLIDGRNNRVAGGDILYQFTIGKICEENATPDFQLDPDTQMVTSDPQGRFTLPLPAADHRHCLLLNASKSGYATTVVNLDLNTQPELIELELEKHRVLSGQVLTSEGHPQPGARVKRWLAANTTTSKAEPDACAEVDPESVTHTSAGDEGRFQLDTAGNNRFCVQASHPDWASSDTQWIDGEAADSQPITLRLKAPSRVGGQVRNQNAEPVADLPLRLQPVAAQANPSPVTATTDSMGRFHFPQVDAVRYQLLSGDPRYAVASPQTVAPRAGDAMDLEVSVYPVTTVTGRLLDDSGQPVEGARVTARSPYLPSLSITSGTSDSQGYFEIQTQHRSKAVREMQQMTTAFAEQAENKGQTRGYPPRLCLQVHHPQWRADEISLDTTEVQVDLGSLYMQRPRLSLDGRLLNHRDQPLAGELSFQPITKAPAAPSRCEDSSAPLRVQADEEGHFSLSLEQTGSYEVEVKTQRYQTRTLELELDRSSAPLEIKLR